MPVVCSEQVLASDGSDVPPTAEVFPEAFGLGLMKDDYSESLISLGCCFLRTSLSSDPACPLRHRAGDSYAAGGPEHVLSDDEQ